MSLPRLSSRLARLEAQHPAEAEPPYVPPEPSEEWWAEFLSLVWEYRRWFSECDESDDSPYRDVMPSLVADLRCWATQTCTPETLPGLHGSAQASLGKERRHSKIECDAQRA